MTKAARRPQFRQRDIISINDFSRGEILYLLAAAAKMEKRRQPERLLRNKIMGSLFLEPSTRTRLSFESAMTRLGGRVIGFADPQESSIRKGETLADTIRMVEKYSDVIVLRHPREGAARLAAEVAAVPVINGGDGANQHPTQTFLDLHAISTTQPKLFNRKGKTLNVGFIGDLKYGRTVHSLVTALSLFNSRLFFISPPSLAMPPYYLDLLEERRIPYLVDPDLTRVLPELDILYATRIQAERFPDPLEYARVRHAYTLNCQALEGARKNLKVLHPLPRVTEIDPEVDATPYAFYFQQASLGLPVRQALLALVLGATK